MFTKSQFNSKPDKAPSKPSVFPHNGNIIKKKARSTILSVLTKRQTQEKFLLGDKTDGQRDEQNGNVITSKPFSPEPKWVASEAMIVDLEPTGSGNSQTLRYSDTTQPTYQPAALDQNKLTPSKVPVTRSISLQSKFLSSNTEGEKANHQRAERDELNGGTKVSKICARWPPQKADENWMGKNTHSLCQRRHSAPKHLSWPATDIEPMVVSMSPSYASVKDISPTSSPTSTKSVNDSVKVSIPFQVQGQQQSPRVEQQSDAWASSVSVCVPFQVNENGESVPISPFANKKSLPSSSPRDSIAEADTREVSISMIKESNLTMSPNSQHVVKSSTTAQQTEGDSFSAMNKMSPSQPSLPKGNTSLLTPDDGKGVSRDMADAGVVNKPRAISSPPSPSQGKRKISSKDHHIKDNKQVLAKAHSPKIMGKEASKHKNPTGKAATSTALKVPFGGKPRARSFTAGEKTKLTPFSSSAQSSPTGTPKSVSPASSPKAMRRHLTPKDATKAGGRKTTELKKLESHGRPHSDPLIGEKMQAKKKSTGAAASDVHTTAGKAKSDLEVMKNKVKELESENLELKTKLQGMEHRLAVVPLLEKEKLHLQKQVNEVVQENEKKTRELETLNSSSVKLKEEMNGLQAEGDKLKMALETSQEQIKELRANERALEELKSTLTQENEDKTKSITEYIENIEKLTTSNSKLILQDGLSKKKITTLLQGLQSLNDSVLQLKEENKCLQSQIVENGIELVGTMRNCVDGLERVISGLQNENSEKAEKETQVFDDTKTIDKDTQCDEVRSKDLLLRELEESKLLVECLKSRISEVEEVATKTSAEQQESRANNELPLTPPSKGSDCSGCTGLQEQLASVKSNLDSFKDSFQKLEGERDEAVEEMKELRREAKYLKYVLCYREDVQNLQSTNQQSKELEKLGSNLVEAEKKVIDLEDEVGRLQEEKQTLLMSILNLHSGHRVDDVMEEENEGEESDSESESNDDENQDEPKVIEHSRKADSISSNTDSISRNTDSISRREQLKYRFQLSLSESDYSFSSGQRTEGEEDTESEIEDDENEKTWMLLKKIKAENRQLKSSLNEANDEKEELLSNLDKLCEEFDALKENYDKLEEEHATLSEKAKQDKHSLQTRLRGVELDRDNLKDSLREIQDEKLALLKCLEMRNTEPMSPLSPLPQPLLDKIITQAQSFTQEEHKSNEPTSNEEYSDASSSSDEEEEEKVSVPQTSRESGTDLEKEPDVTSTNAKDKELASLVAAIENDLGKLKERLAKGESNAQGTLQDDDAGKEKESRPRKPAPGERMLKRQASTVKSNLDRVCREKQHLQDEVESLRRYLLKRRDSAMDTRIKRSHGSLKRVTAEVDSHLEGIKTLQALLGKSDDQLRQSNDIISRLEALNDETEEKLRDSELHQEDLRHAVMIANNFAMEEQQKAKQLMLQNEELLKKVEILMPGETLTDKIEKDENSLNENSRKAKNIPKLKKANGRHRSVSEDDALYADDESNFTTEGESDFFSSRQSSVADESEFARSPTPHEEDLDISNSNVTPSEEPSKRGDLTESDLTSQYSSTADTHSDLSEEEDDTE